MGSNVDQRVASLSKVLKIERLLESVSGSWFAGSTNFAGVIAVSADAASSYWLHEYVPEKHRYCMEVVTPDLRRQTKASSAALCSLHLLKRK